MDKKSVYEFTGVPVDLNYGTITFHILSPPEKIAGEAPKPAKDGEELSGKDALCLAEACRITALMNDGKWDEVAKAFGTKEEMVAILKHQATLKDWPGSGPIAESEWIESPPAK